MTPAPSTTADADRLLGMADQFLEDWESNGDSEARVEAAERRVEWDAIRPVLVQAPALAALVSDAVTTWAACFAADEDINGGDLVEWFAQWLQRAQGVPPVPPQRVNASADAHHYRVGWEIDIYADTAEDAARKALAIQRDPTSIATQFNVRGGGGTMPVEVVDFDPEVGAPALPGQGGPS